MLGLTVSASLETTSGFTLGTSQLDTGVLGYLQTSITAPVRSASWSRGRNSIFDNFSAGSATVIFDNRDRLLDPKNTSSVLYGQLYPGRQFSIFVSQGSSTATVFAGYVDSWEYDYTIDGDATVTVRVIDAFSYLAGKTISSISAPAELSGARVQRVLASIGWPVSKQAIDVGYSTLAAETISGVTALDYLTDVATSEFGMFFIDRQGIATFKSRNAVLTFSDVRITNVVGDTNSVTSDINFDYSFDRVFNKVTLTNSAISATATSTNTTSSGTYGERPRSFNVQISNATQMQSVADGLVNLYGTPSFVPRNAVFNFENFDLFVTSDVSIKAKPKLNFRTIDIGYLTSVYWLPPGISGTTDAISISAMLISGVKYDARPDLFTVTVELDYALGYNSFILDDLVQGVLDTGILGV